MGVALAWSPPFFFVVPADYNDFVLPWYRHIVAYGPLAAFGHPFSNYTPPYLYFLSAATLVGGPPIIVVKSLSVISAAWAAYGAYRVLRELGLWWALEGVLAMLLLPTMIINVPLYGQADMFWIAPCLLAVAAACRGENLVMVVWASIAFAFKAQSIFLAPFVIAMLLNRRSPLWFWALPPAIYAIAMLPAWLAGWPAWDLLTVYVRQAEYVPSNGVSFVSTASNPWALFRFINYDLAIRSYWVGFLAASIATVSYIAYFASRRLSKDDMVAAAALSAAMLPFLLPGMHERFFVLAELCAFCWALAVRSRGAIAVAALLQLQFVLSYFGWVLRRPELTIAGGILTAVALGLLLACIARTRESAASGRLSELHG